MMMVRSTTTTPDQFPYDMSSDLKIKQTMLVQPNPVHPDPEQPSDRRPCTRHRLPAPKPPAPTPPAPTLFCSDAQGVKLIELDLRGWL
ncbi:hypothetical protein QVD17_25564 [Tagetes erecta]|uniref:Uncharacterized protein n=1 Tax=Tagetes erecta TaxID=13708 RepID=A0AAD8NNB0_TARER|nr:hypothetical protein QVD17_25564 [Tagetes erecta]